PFSRPSVGVFEKPREGTERWKRKLSVGGLSSPEQSSESGGRSSDVGRPQRR
ncbi:hypothetical protein V6N12_073638, partial [Hibiscus sabdariffa]